MKNAMEHARSLHYLLVVVSSCILLSALAAQRGPVPGLEAALQELTALQSADFMREERCLRERRQSHEQTALLAQWQTVANVVSEGYTVPFTPPPTDWFRTLSEPASSATGPATLEVHLPEMPNPREHTVYWMCHLLEKQFVHFQAVNEASLEQAMADAFKARGSCLPVTGLAWIRLDTGWWSPVLPMREPQNGVRRLTFWMMMGGAAGDMPLSVAFQHDDDEVQSVLELTSSALQPLGLVEERGDGLMFLPATRTDSIWRIVKDKTLPEAVRALDDLANDSIRGIPLPGGFEIPTRAALLACPYVCLLLLLSLAATVDSAQSVAGTVDTSSLGFPWIALCAAVPYRIATCVSLVLLPTIANGLLIFEAWQESGTLISIAAACVLANLVLGITVTRGLSRVRRTAHVMTTR